ncbi:MAG: YfhO family protein [Candidatus Omnitrophota bacterium]
MKKKCCREGILLIILLALCLAVCFYDVIFSGKTFKVTNFNPQAMSHGVYGSEEGKTSFFPVISTDSSIIEEPFYQFIRNSLRQGVLPLWNPHQACGFPLIALMQVGIFFPLSCLLYFLPQVIAWDAMILARFFLAGLFTYYLMRTLRFKPAPSLAAAMIYMLSGPMVLLQYWFANVEIIAPLVLLSLERLRRCPDLKNIVFVSFAVALTFYAGHAEHIFFVNLAGFLFFCFRLVTVKTVHPRIKVFLKLLMAYALAFGLSAMVLLPFLKNFQSEFWNNHGPATGLIAESFKVRAISMIVPYFFQKHPVAANFTPMGWTGGYIGLVPMALAFLGLLGKQRRGLNYFLFAAAFLNISKTYFGFPFINWIGYLPLFRHCRFYMHTTHLFALSVAMLAGMGVRYAFAQKKMFRRGLIFVVPAAGLTVFYLYHFRKANHFQLSLRACLFAGIIIILFQLLLFLRRYLNKKHFGTALILLIIAELFFYIPRGRDNRINSFPEVPYINFLKEPEPRQRAFGIFWAFYPNAASGYGVDDVGIVLEMLPRRFVNFVNQFIRPGYFQKDLSRASFWVSPFTFKEETRSFFNLLNVGYTVAPNDFNKFFNRGKVRSFLEPAYEGEVKIFHDPAVLPRAFVVHRVIFEPDEEKSFQKILAIREHFRQVAVIQHEPLQGISSRLKNVPVVDSSRSTIVKYSPNEVLIDADMENPGFLVFSDGYHPDWKAYSESGELEIFIANHLVRSVFLEKGKHRVKFRFEPPEFYFGVIISAVSMLIAGFLLSRVKFR